MLSLDMLIDLGIEVAGFLAGGALLVVLFPRLGLITLGQAHRRPAGVPTESQTATAREGHSNTGTGTAVPRMSYVPLTASQPSAAVTVPATATETSQYRRNRQEVIGLARQMLAAGSSREQIQRAAPLSEGELALLAGN